MIYFTPFQPRHIRRLVGIQGEQAEDAVFAISLEEAAGYAAHPSWTGWIGADVVGCAGIIPVWENRSMVWALIGERCGPHMLKITRFVREQLRAHPARRVEATVLTGFEAGEQWMELLGFKCETPNGMCSYDPAGRTMSLYSRISHDRT